MDWNDDELGDHLDDADGYHYEMVGRDLADMPEQDIEDDSDSDTEQGTEEGIEEGNDFGIDLGVSETVFADLETDVLANEEAELDPDLIGEGDGLSGDEGQAWERESEPNVDALSGAFVLDDALAAQIEGSLNTSELMALTEEAREFYNVRLVEINGGIRPFGEREDVDLWLRHVRQGRRHWAKDRRSTVSPLGNSREYQVRAALDAGEKAEADAIRYRKKKAEGDLTRKPASEKELAQKCHEHCLYKVRQARKTKAFRSLLDEGEVELFEASAYDEAKVAYMAKNLSKVIEAAQREERKARTRGVKSIMLQRGIGKTQANRIWNEMEERIKELLTIIQKGPDAYNTQVEINQFITEMAEIKAAMREHSQQ